MILVASLVGALIFGYIGGFFVKSPRSPEGELTQLAWALVGVIVGVSFISLLGVA